MRILPHYKEFVMAYFLLKMQWTMQIIRMIITKVAGEGGLLDNFDLSSITGALGDFDIGSLLGDFDLGSITDTIGGLLG